MEAFDRVLPYKSLGSFIKQDAKFFIYAIEDTNPLIKIQVKIKKISDKMIGELSFFTDEFGFDQLNISSSGKAISIIATVADLGKKFIPQLDIIFFTAKLLVSDDTENLKAEKEVKSKSFIYGRITARVAKENNLNYQKFSINDDTGFLLTKDSEIEKADIIQYYNEWNN